MSLKAYEDACTRAELFGQPLPDKDEFLEKHKHLDVVEFEEVEIRTAEIKNVITPSKKGIETLVREGYSCRFLEKHYDFNKNVTFEKVTSAIRPTVIPNTAMLDDQMKYASGGLQELNTILNSTQTKINKLKGVCGSLTNFFRVKLTARDNLSYSSEQSYVGQINYDKGSVAPTNDDISSINQGLGPEDNEMTPRQDGGKQDGGKQHCANKKGGNQHGDVNSALKDLEEMQNNENTNLISKGTVKDIGKQVTSQVSRLDQMLQQTDRAEASLSHQNKQMRSFLR